MGAKYKLVRICTVEEAEEKMEMGICFICDIPFTVEHQLLHHTNIQMIMKENEEETELDSEGPIEQKQNEGHGSKSAEAYSLTTRTTTFGDNDTDKLHGKEKIMELNTKMECLDKTSSILSDCYDTHCVLPVSIPTIIPLPEPPDKVAASVSSRNIHQAAIEESLPKTKPRDSTTCENLLQLQASLAPTWRMKLPWFWVKELRITDPILDWEKLKRAIFERLLFNTPPNDNYNATEIPTSPPIPPYQHFQSMKVLFQANLFINCTYHNPLEDPDYTLQVFDMSCYFLETQLVNLASLQDTPNLVELTSMFSNVKFVTGFTYFYYDSDSNTQDQTPKFEFDQIPIKLLCTGAELLGTNWQTEVPNIYACIQKHANTIKNNGSFDSLEINEFNLQQFHELSIALHVHIWNYLNALFLDDYGYVLVDLQDSWVEANLDSAKKWLVDVYNSPAWKPCLAPLYDTYHCLTKKLLLIFQHTKLVIVLHRKMIYNGHFYALKVLSKWKDWFSTHGSYLNISLENTPMIIMHSNGGSLHWSLRVFNTVVNRETIYWRALMSAHMKLNYFKGMCCLEEIPISLGITIYQATSYAVFSVATMWV
ncbi:unnamed protein product [Trifolium pratense]|uniref:Uncharacterized protein n=1 Tax=Trifolium pratense TaxID=57577 RepID=A0ACB0JNI2_TRIPR|nr:unnamed protein product [Trifolium pratense]